MSVMLWGAADNHTRNANTATVLQRSPLGVHRFAPGVIVTSEVVFGGREQSCSGGAEDLGNGGAAKGSGNERGEGNEVGLVSGGAGGGPAG